MPALKMPQAEGCLPPRVPSAGSLAFVATWRAASQSKRCRVVIKNLPQAVIYATLASSGTALRWTTMRHAASLRPSENGRIGFKPPYSKRGTAAKAPSIFIGIGSIGGPSSSCGQKAFNHAIPFLEDRSDAACRVVYVDLHPGIPFLPIGEPGYCGLGRGGAERSECPPTRICPRRALWPL